MSHLKSTNQGLWKKELHINKVLIVRRLFSPQQNGLPSALFFHSSRKWMENSSNGCEDFFLEWRLEISVFMSHQENKVCKLIKSLYCLKQAPRAWYEKLIEHLLKLNFKHFNLNDASLFVKKFEKLLYILSYT
jgi:hypothetical protein